MKPEAITLDCPPDCHRCELRQTGTFLPFSSEKLDYIQSFRKSTMEVAGGRQIIAEHKSSGHLFTLYRGWAFRYKTLSDGRRQILNFLVPGDFIGLQEEFADGATHGVEALTNVSLCVFPRDGLWQLYRDDPQLAYDITWLAAREESLLDEGLLTVGRRTALERVAMLLVHLYRRAERVGLAREGSIAFPFNQQHIADALGLSLVHTNKTLRRLGRLGLHTLEEGRLVMNDPRGLQDIADYYQRPLRTPPLI
ncbi:Crp/Fnr family transcriptional regulator [Xylophilus sp. GOD-11R]|uniref:Crp/Fnr family transcriptional regulator n=1 Tax=Xylophilus sp. GOD-11R TaxID=3089814 RepID=UPI00399C404C